MGRKQWKNRLLRTMRKTITQVVAEHIAQFGSAKLIGKDEKVVANWKDYKITKKSNYILYEQK